MGLNNYPYPSYTWDFQGVDFAYIPVTQELAYQMYEDGIRFVGRYLYADRYPNGKGITAQELQYYLTAGIRVFFFYEFNTTDALGGYDRGQTNGIACLTEINDLQIPVGTQIYCCCDTGVSDTDASGVVMDYLQGFSDALPDYNCGIYGGTNVVEACYNTFPLKYRCQAGAELWGTQEFDPINVRQWVIGKNRNAERDGYIHIQNVAIDSDGYATWRGYNVDLISADSLENMVGDDSPTPPTPTPTDDGKMPIWFYLKLF